MRIITANLNGVRSAAQKGYFNWQRRQGADVICLQEIRAHPAQMPPEALHPRRYFSYFSRPERKGYSGVAIYARRPADRVVTDLGWASWDREGRYLQADFGDLSVISLYMPSGSSGEIRLRAKLEFMDRLLVHLSNLARGGRAFVLCGDLNIAHQKIDLENWRSNQKNSGFLPEERAWMDRLLGEAGWVDAFRQVCPLPRQYTWWSNRGQAYLKNVGWRLDYQLVTANLQERVQSASIYTKRRFSDHAPLVMDYALDFETQAVSEPAHQGLQTHRPLGSRSGLGRRAEPRSSSCPPRARR